MFPQSRGPCTATPQMPGPSRNSQKRVRGLLRDLAEAGYRICSAQTGRRAYQARLEKWCTMHSQPTPGTNSNAVPIRYAVQPPKLISKTRFSNGSHSGLLTKCFFGGLGYQGQKNTLFRKIQVRWPCRRRRQGQQTCIFLNNVFFGPWYPRPPKKHLANKPLRDPSGYS